MDKKESINILINDFGMIVEEIEGMTKKEIEDLLDELYNDTVEDD